MKGGSCGACSMKLNGGCNWFGTKRRRRRSSRKTRRTRRRR